MFRSKKGLMSGNISYASLDSPLGTVWLAATSRGLARVSFGTDEVEFTFELERAFGTTPRWEPDGLEPMIRQLDEYFAGDRRAFDLPIDLSRASEFQRAVLETVRQVPYGEVQSYGDIAFAVGKPLAARAVGGVMATNPVSIVIPCHRIVRSDGTHGEYALRTLGPSGATAKQVLLTMEARGIAARSSHPGC
jgi:methylated-DNA-[protein]-cysteine S-methyltransferase